jgi:hypothetical protein
MVPARGGSLARTNEKRIWFQNDYRFIIELRCSFRDVFS